MLFSPSEYKARNRLSTTTTLASFFLWHIYSIMSNKRDGGRGRGRGGRGGRGGGPDGSIKRKGGHGDTHQQQHHRDHGGRINVAVYFGSFDPIHENHLALALHSTKKAVRAHTSAAAPAATPPSSRTAPAVMNKVFLVPNENNPRKPFVAPVEARRNLIRARLAAAPDTCGAVEVFVPNFGGRRGLKGWEWRAEVCEQIQRHCADPSGEGGAVGGGRGGGGRGGGGRGGGGRGGGGRGGGGPRVSMFQLMGQDSFEQPGAQSALQSENVRRNIRRTLIIYPRSSCETVKVNPAITRPDKRSNSVRVQVASDYSDPVKDLSSTRVRAALQRAGTGGTGGTAGATVGAIGADAVGSGAREQGCGGGEGGAPASAAPAAPPTPAHTLAPTPAPAPAPAAPVSTAVAPAEVKPSLSAGASAWVPGQAFVPRAAAAVFTPGTSTPSGSGGAFNAAADVPPAPAAPALVAPPPPLPVAGDVDINTTPLPPQMQSQPGQHVEEPGQPVSSAIAGMHQSVWDLACELRLYAPVRPPPRPRTTLQPAGHN